MTRLLLGIKDIKVDIRYPKSRTPLSFAAEQGFVGVTRLLLAAGADPNTRDDLMRRTPLHWAGSPQLAGESRDMWQQNIFREPAHDPISNFHCPLSVYFEIDIIGSPLWMEKEREKTFGKDGVLLALNPHWRPLIQPNIKYSRWSAGANYKEILHLLLQYGAQLGLEDLRYRTPFLWAATCGYQPLVEILLDSGISLEPWKPVPMTVSNKDWRLLEKEKYCKKVVNNPSNRYFA